MKINREAVIAQLNKILECELAGVVRYTHYSMMIFGYSRIPIVSWFQAEAAESLTHAQQAGEMVTRLGGHPSLAIGPLLETHERFPNRTNVQVARRAGAHELEARVWERGAGETASSGSSAVAVAAAFGCEDVTVRFPGGPLQVRFEGRRAVLTGPAVREA